MKKPMDPTDARGVGKYINLALLMPIATFVGYAVGYGLDALFHTGFLRYAFLALGTVAGFIELIRELNQGT
jgi:hypothetical protein